MSPLPSGRDHQAPWLLTRLWCSRRSTRNQAYPFFCSNRRNHKGCGRTFPIEALRKLRLLLEDFPRNHNLILIGQPSLNTTIQLRHNHDLKTRITYSAKLEALTAVHLTEFIHSQLDRVGLPHATFTEEAINLITRSAEGTLRAVRNLCIGALIEAVRDHTKTVDLKQVNALLLQPHWRHNTSGEPTEPVLIPPRNLPPRS